MRIVTLEEHVTLTELIKLIPKKVLTIILLAELICHGT